MWGAEDKYNHEREKWWMIMTARLYWKRNKSSNHIQVLGVGFCFHIWRPDHACVYCSHLGICMPTWWWAYTTTNQINQTYNKILFIPNNFNLNISSTWAPIASAKLVLVLQNVLLLLNYFPRFEIINFKSFTKKQYCQLTRIRNNCTIWHTYLVNKRKYQRNVVFSKLVLKLADDTV